MPDWNGFQRKHILNPNDDPQYDRWDRADWNNWLQNRIGSDYGSKNLNSVIISTPNRVIASFDDLESAVGYSNKHNFYWSSEQFFIYVLRLKRNNLLRNEPPYQVFKLPLMYFLALIEEDPNRPVHYHNQSPIKLTSGVIQVNFNNFEEIL